MNFTSDDIARVLRRNRSWLTIHGDDPVAQVNAAAWMFRNVPCGSWRRGVVVGDLKHRFERALEARGEGRYVSGGATVVAAVLMNVPILQKGPNAVIDVPRSWFKKISPLPPRLASSENELALIDDLVDLIRYLSPDEKPRSSFWLARAATAKGLNDFGDIAPFLRELLESAENALGSRGWYIKRHRCHNPNRWSLVKASPSEITEATYLAARLMAKRTMALIAGVDDLLAKTADVSAWSRRYGRTPIAPRAEALALTRDLLGTLQTTEDAIALFRLPRMENTARDAGGSWRTGPSSRSKDAEERTTIP